MKELPNVPRFAQWLEDGQFKDMVAMATDPVCGMAVEHEKAVSAEWGNQILYFCSRGCRNEFLEDARQLSDRALLRQLDGVVHLLEGHFLVRGGQADSLAALRRAIGCSGIGNESARGAQPS
jgi:YHS domain-containing protein